MPAPPVLLVHGFASSFDVNWRQPGWVDLLEEEGREVIGPDLLGHGSSPKPHDPLAYASMEAGIEEVLPSGDEPVDAIGFSLGAQLLLRVACTSPWRFRKLVLGGVGANLFAASDPELAAQAVEAGEGDPDADEGGTASVGGMAAVPALAHFAQSPGNDPQALAACLRRPHTALSVDELAKLTMPVLVVLGDRDFAGPPDPLVDALPAAKLVVLKGCDHFATPRDFRFVDAALEFLRGDA